MYSVGIDTHKIYSQITIMQENGKIINRCKVNNDQKSIKRALMLKMVQKLLWNQARTGDYLKIW